MVTEAVAVSIAAITTGVNKIRALSIEIPPGGICFKDNARHIIPGFCRLQVARPWSNSGFCLTLTV